MFCGTLLGTRRWTASTGEEGTDGTGTGAGASDLAGAGGGAGAGGEGGGSGAPLLRFDSDGSRDDCWSRGGYGELGSRVRFLKANGVVSAGPRPGPLESVDIRGDGRLNAAAEMVRVPGGSGDEEGDLFGPVAGGRLFNGGGR